jgi:hypothetical protein
MAGPDPAIHATTGLVAFAWMLGSSPSMTERQAGMTVEVLQPDLA